MFNKRFKQSYHTDLILEHQLGILSPELLKNIPSSTLHNWKNRDINNLIGNKKSAIPNDKIETTKIILSRNRLYQICRALVIAFHVYDSIFSGLKNKNSVLRKAKSLLIPSIENIASTVGLKRTLRYFHISYQQFHAWKRKRKCTLSPAFICFRKHPLQISIPEISIIKKYFQNYNSWDLKAIYYKMLKDGAAFMSLSTWYTYASYLGLKSLKPDSRRKKHTVGIRATAPKQIIHMDVTVFRPMDNTKVYIYLIVDNFSRCILGWKASMELKCSLAMETLHQACIDHDLFNSNTKVDLIVDGGSENNCHVFNNYIELNKKHLRKLVAQKDIVFSNSMVEAAHKSLKYQYLFKRDLANIKAVENYLPIAIKDHSNKPHGALFGLTPLEASNGAIPDKYFFKSLIGAARNRRIVVNRKSGCEFC